ncbi:MAG TPA: hypothetical protein VFS41_11320 [Edaphobacter sp.]|nr:hypothetical protein [Edaphobacter sp.]
MSKPADRAIAVIEPQMEGLFHAPFNAALLHAVMLAYPDSPISFQGFPEHCRIVRQILEQNTSIPAERIDWRVVPVPHAKSLPARWLETRRSIRQAASSADRVLFCSISRMQLLHLKNFLSARPQLQVRAVLHGDLDRILSKSKESFPSSLFSLERVLQMSHPSGLRYLLLGESIRQYIPEQFQKALATSSAMDHPYHFPAIQSKDHRPFVFGIFGNTGDGRMLEQVARRVKEIDPSVKFRLIGFLSNREAVERLRPFVEGVTDRPISRENFIAQAQEITHSLWLASPNSFQLRASGTFFDALAYGKPIVYTANPYIDFYFSLMPRIGYRCESLEHVPDMIVSIVRTETQMAYSEAQVAMQHLRDRFTPEQLAKTLPAKIGWHELNSSREAQH